MLKYFLTENITIWLKQIDIISFIFNITTNKSRYIPPLVWSYTTHSKEVENIFSCIMSELSTIVVRCQTSQNKKNMLCEKTA